MALATGLVIGRMFGPETFAGGVVMGVIATLAALAVEEILRKGWQRRLEHRRAAAKRKALLEADFLAGAADLGEVDHGVNTTETIEAIQALLYEALTPMVRIIENLFRETPQKLPTDMAKKQLILKQCAREIHPDVVQLEKVAERIRPQSKAFITAYRTLFKKPVLTDGDRKAQLRDTYRGGVADTFKQCADLLAKRRKDILMLNGKQQDLSRMIGRLAKAMREIDEAVDSVSKFCSGEMVRTIDRLIGP